MSTWILLRGLAREARHWGDFPARLQRRLPDARLLAIDLPGNGACHAQASPSRIASITASLRDELAARGDSPPYHLLALSLGAMVAVDWATRHPDELAGAVLINTSLRGFSPFHQRLRPANYLRLLRIACAGSDEARERAILAMTSAVRRGADERGALVEAWCAYRRERPVSAANAVRQLFAAARYRAPPSAPPVPLLLLASRGDALCDVRCSRRIAQRWGLVLAEHPAAGHDLPLDAGEWVAHVIAAWLAANGRG